MNQSINKAWSSLEIKKLRHYFKSKTVREISKKLNRSIGSVRYKIYSLRLVKPSKASKKTKIAKLKKKNTQKRIKKKTATALPPRPPKRKPEKPPSKKEKSKQKKNTHISSKKRA